MRSPPRGLLFDLGNTLLKEDRFDAEAGTEHVLGLARNPRGLSVADVCELVSDLEADLRRRREESLLEIPPFSVHRLVYEPNGISFDRPFPEIELEFLRAAVRFSPTPGASELLRHLHDADVPLGVVSNAAFTSAALAWQLEQSDLLRYLRFVMSSADYVVRKPHPRIFLTAAAKLGTAPGETWFVGDSLHYDVQGATGSGMVAVWYNPDRLPSGEPVAGLEIHGWPQLLELIGPLG